MMPARTRQRAEGHVQCALCAVRDPRTVEVRIPTDAVGVGHELQGPSGRIISDQQYALGEVLILNGMLYMGADFITLPSPNQHVYLSSIIDPRDVTFPDETAIDLGSIKDAYGAHSYAIPAGTDQTKIRTVVLWDQEFKRVYGFAQVSMP